MRSQTNKILILGLAIVLIFAGSYIYSPKHDGLKKPALSKNSGSYLADAELMNIREAIAFYEHKTHTEPNVIQNYTSLAVLKMKQARLAGNHHESYTEVQQLLDNVLKTEPENFEAVLTQASLYLNYHQFEEAKAWAEKAITINSFNALAWGIYSDALKELGEYGAAVQACDKMLSIRPDLRSYSRAAHLRELHGDIPGAKAAMKMAVNAGVVGYESHSWALYQLGNLYLKEGKTDSAKSIYNAILETNPHYAMAHKGLTEAALQEGNYGQALNSIHAAYNISPRHEFAEMLVTVYRLSGDHQKAERLAQHVIKEFQVHEKLGWNVNLEYAMFCLENDVNLKEAMQRISEEMARRPRHKSVIAAHEMALAKSSKS